MRNVVGPRRRVHALVGIVLLLSVGLPAALTPSVAAAATNPPWRFKTVTSTFEIQPGYNIDWPLQCPSGYRPVSGGVSWDHDHPSGHLLERRYEYTDQPSATYHVNAHLSLYAPSALQVRVNANCVWTANFGEIRYVTDSFSRDSSTHRSSGRVDCPAGYRVITGGADWDVHGGKESVDYSTPVLDNNGFGVAWFAMGYNGDSSKLSVEAYCVEAAYLASEYATVDISNAATANYQDRSAEAFCKQGYRILTGGSRPWSLPYPRHDHGWSWASGPASAQSWPARASVANGDQLAAVALCIPASEVSLDITTSPDTPTNSTDATFRFVASDQAGENLLIRCKLDDDVARPCTSASSSVYHGLAEGVHTFTVSVANQSGSSRSIWTAWKVDLTKPELVSWTPTSDARVTSPVMMTFSEPVGGVNATSMTVLRNHGNGEVAGYVSYSTPTVISWSPKKPLIPGETYAFVFDGTIHDAAGNHLTPVNFSLKTSTLAENATSAIRETWDSDDRSIARGGTYITSRDADSRAELTFVATAGQTVSVFGVRRPDGGYADIYLDGVKKKRVSFYAPSATRALIYSSNPLIADTHQISIRPSGTGPASSSGAWVSIDTIAVGATLFEESALRQTFTRVDLPGASAGSYDRVTHVRDGDRAPAIRAQVVGTGVDIYAVKTPRSGKAQIFVDGTLRATVDLKAATTQPDVLVFSMGFAEDLHTIRIEAVGTTTGQSSAIGFDRLVVH